MWQALPFELFLMCPQASEFKVVKEHPTLKDVRLGMQASLSRSPANFLSRSFR